MWLRLRNVEIKKAFVLSSARRIPDPYLLCESPRPISFLGTLIPFLLGDPRLLNLPRNWLSQPPVFSLGELYCQGKGESFSFRNCFLLLRAVVPKSLRQHSPNPRVEGLSPRGPKVVSWRRLQTSKEPGQAICDFTAFKQLQTNHVIQLQR